MSDFKARPTVYKGIRMRSRLEAGFAAWLDANGFDWEYEPQAFASEAGQYLPDFRLAEIDVAGSAQGAACATAYVEVKPDSFDFTDVEKHAALARSMGVIHESEPDALLLLVRPSSVHMLRTAPGQFGWGSMEWAWVTSSVGSRPIGLVFPLARHRRPWPDEFWRVD